MQEVPLAPTDFAAFFKALWGFEPFPWQERLLLRLATGTDVATGTMFRTAARTSQANGQMSSTCQQVQARPQRSTSPYSTSLWRRSAETSAAHRCALRLSSIVA